MKFFKKKQDDIFKSFENEIIDEYSVTPKSKPITSPDVLTPDELNGDFYSSEIKFSSSSLSPLDSLKKRMISDSITTDTSEDTVSTTKKPQDSLLERCKAYTTDDSGKNYSVSDKKLYKLESVAEILKSDSERAIEKLSQKYDVTVSDLKVLNSNSEKETTDELEIKFDSLPISEDLSEILAVESKTMSIPDISDIDTVQKHTVTEPAPIDSATVRFTPIKNLDSGESRMSVSSTTKTIDISSELKSMSFEIEQAPEKTDLEETEFEEFNAKEEYTDTASGKKLIRKLSIRKRNHFLATITSFALALFTSLFAFTPLGDLLITKPKTALIICSIMFSLNVLVNVDMFVSIKKIFSLNCNPDSLAAITSLATLVLTFLQIKEKLIGYYNNIYYIVLAASIVLFMRAVGCFWDISAKLGNLKQIATPRPKKAVDLITNTATTFAMAKNSIEGDILVATPRNTEFVAGFMKYSEFGNSLSGRMRLVTIVSLLTAIILGVSSGIYLSSAISGFYSASAILCLASIPCLFFVDVLPIYSASKTLNKKGAMIAGKAAAERLEMANAAVISTTDIFPDGTVTLQNIKVLSENNIDDTLIRAAALTEAVGSPLTPIFKKIAKTNNSYTTPDSDDVKYEERLGLSGWIGDVMLFVGNRTLLESHGIDLPDIEVDKKILRAGNFPVYIACEGKACALVVIRYTVDSNVVRELRRITELGVTLLVNNHDPNINEEMLCDYFGLYNDSVKIMSNAGVHMYKNATIPLDHCVAPASFRSSPLTFISIINCASRIKKANTLLSVLYLLFSILGAAALIYMTFSGTGTVPSGTLILLYSLFSTVISILTYFINKP